ncbi:hypothetical protein GQ53DRAFT_735008 [Thozetella sp. PMI_491]|nr:hypothetical protein GQ53DRAFT_735008 [Thozetella sp. PMI_491]
MSEDRKTIFHEHFSVNNDKEELTKRYCKSPSSLHIHGHDDLRCRLAQILHDCRSRSSHRRSRAGCPAILLLALSIFSTFFSGVWLTAAIMQPTWGRFISASGPLPPDTASTLTALFAKLIEISFVSVFVAHMGQVLTRRAFGDQVRGVTLSELTTLRNWVMQPGTLITGYEAVPIVIRKFLAWICLAAALAASLYTTASDAMVSPKLMFGQWQHRVLTGHAMSSYANNTFVRESCVTPITMDTQEIAGDACLGVAYPGHSYHNFFEFMSAWHSFATNGTTKRVSKGNRPLGTATLYNDTTLITAWAEQETSNVTRNFEQHGRIIDNITLAIPHPGVYGAALDSINDILQPVDSSGVGEYRIQASTLSPAVGVMCVNMELDEIAPLIDTQGSGAITNQVGDGGDNLTVVDDIFYWGDAYGRRRPVFPVLPLDFNIITDATVPGDAIYILGKKNTATFYTLCELRSWLSPHCSSQLEVSGTTGNILRASCGDTSDTNRYEAVFPNTPVVPSNDWHDVAREWQSSVDLNAGITNSNSSSHRILTELILDRPSMPDSLPSMAEGLAVLASSTLVFSSLNAQLRHDWDETSLVPPPGLAQRFNASIMMQEYTSSHTQTWQLAIFYPVLGLLFLLNAVCLVIHANKLRRGTLLTDFTDPANTFALAINSPPSEAMKGCCGGGPDRTDLAVPWRVAYSQAADHYYFEEAQAGGKVLRHGSYRGIAHRGDVVGGQDDVATQPSGDHAARASPYG